MGNECMPAAVADALGAFAGVGIAIVLAAAYAFARVVVIPSVRDWWRSRG